MRGRGRPVRLALALVAALSVWACGDTGTPPPEHERLTDVETLRQTFNADEGKLRALFLASPT